MIRCLVFDWGDTVMETYGIYSGAMVVAAVEGITRTLEELEGHYRFAIGSNAKDSDATQIRAALDRVGIGHYFSYIFSSAEVNACKPDEAFFRSIEGSLGLDRDEFMMIGDSYAVDVLGAWQAGWHSAWYNPSMTFCPGHLPVHDIEIHAMADLPALLGRPIVPSVNTCLEWIQTNFPSTNLLVHVQMVASCAYQMALWLLQNGREVDPILAHRGGLLHDLAKLWPQKEMDHGLAAAVWLKKQGEPALAEIASRHMIFEILNKERCPRTWEEKLVYLADKLIEKNSIVSVDDRIAGLRTRYSMDPELIEQAYPLIMQLENEVCAAAKINPDELPEKLNQTIYTN